MTDLFERLPDEARDKLQKRDPPSWIQPMLATLADEPFTDEGWIFERKLDGERCLAFRADDTIRLMSRNRNELNDTYPELVDALRQQNVGSFVADGEIVAFEGNVTSFSRLQHRIQIKDPDKARQSNIAVYYYLFDVPYLENHDLTELELRHRKTLLRHAFSYDDPLRFTAHRNAEGEAYYEEVCGKGWEGLIAKDAQAPYARSRSKKWLKLKCVNQQEFVIGGYTDPQGERIGFGALLIGYYRDGDLVYAGKVGTGFDDDTLKRMSDRLASLEHKTAPFAGETPAEKGAHWVTPQLVGEVRFTEWTEDGKLRHPSFLGLRRDKDPKDVVREEPQRT